MNIYLTSLLYKPNIGGVETSIYNLANEYKLMGNNVTILATNLPLSSNLPLVDDDNGIKIVRYPWRKNRMLLFPLDNLFNLIMLVSWIKKNTLRNNSILISRHHIMCIGAFFAGFRNTRYLIPEVIYKIPYISSKFSRKFIEMKINSIFQSIAIKMSSKVFIFSENVKNQLLDIGINCKVEIVKPGIDKMRFSSISKQIARERLNLGPEKKIFLGLGRFIETKGFELVIDSFGDVSDDSAMLLIVGEGPLKEKYNNLIEARGLKDRVIIFNKTFEPELFYAASDVFLMTSYNEAFGQTLFEAMGSSLAVIAFKNGDYGGVSIKTASEEILVNQKGAIICRPFRKELTKSMMEMIANNLYLELGQFNFNQIDRFTWNSLAKKLIHEG